MNPAALSAAANGDMENFLVASTPGGIEKQEAEGQEKFVASTSLPIEINGDETKEDFEKLGFKFGEPVDDLFQEASLPDGWTKRSTDHSMWSEIIDKNGVVRVTVFFKAAFYDMSAFMSLQKVSD